MDWEKYEKIEKEFVNLSEKIALSFALSTIETQELIQRCLLEPLGGFRVQVRNAFMDMEYDYTAKDKVWDEPGMTGTAADHRKHDAVPEFSELDLSDSKPPPPEKTSKRKKK